MVKIRVLLQFQTPQLKTLFKLNITQKAYSKNSEPYNILYITRFKNLK